ncbi:MAG TPA: hypothetical protein VLK30_09995 [Candidatus Limnocylindrales bacterium]|nr:hypothetical protein [Candidatus Limnocylindrales bacterium]
MRRLALVLLFLVAACGSIGVQAHTISLAYKSGDVYKYAFHMALKYTVSTSGVSAPLEVDLKANETLTVKSVDSTGVADIAVQLTDTSVTLSLGGTTNTTTTATMPVSEMKVASNGQIVSINGKALGNNILPGMSEGGLVTAILPDAAVKPGATWSRSFDQPNPMGTGSSHVTTDNTYLRDEKVGAVNTALVDSKIKATLDMSLDLSALGSALGGGSAAPGTDTMGTAFVFKGTSTSHVQSWIDITARRVVKTHSTGSTDATMTANPATASPPAMNGSVIFKGTQTLDLTPA